MYMILDVPCHVSTVRGEASVHALTMDALINTRYEKIQIFATRIAQTAYTDHNTTVRRW